MEEFILTHGSYLAILLLLALTGAGLPVPEEVIIVAAGVLSSPSVGELDPMLALVACLAGALVGDCVMYAIGRGLGGSFIARHRWFARVLHAEREEQMESIVNEHGLKVFLLARFMVGVRSPIYLAMGILRVDFRRFLLCDAACAALVVSVFFMLSYFCGGWIGRAIHESQLAVTGFVLVLLVFGALYYLVWKKCRQQLHLDESDKESTADVSVAPGSSDLL
ncbi:MAG: DedA family protein [Planctomycetota bacterium]|jgi:membrane protein DedA with SNARE-associated domain